MVGRDARDDLLQKRRVFGIDRGHEAPVAARDDRGGIGAFTRVGQERGHRSEHFARVHRSGERFLREFHQHWRDEESFAGDGRGAAECRLALDTELGDAFAHVGELVA